MIKTLPETTTRAVSAELLALRASAGAVALGHVMTLVVSTTVQSATASAAVAVECTDRHPARMLIVAHGDPDAPTGLGAEIRVGADSGTGEVIILNIRGELVRHADAVVTPFLLPDAPIMAWWPGGGPVSPGRDPLGRIASRRVTDAALANNPEARLGELARHYTPGDTDLSWSRLTRWRQLLAHLFDDPVVASSRLDFATVRHAPDSPSGTLLMRWLAGRLGRPVRTEPAPPGSGVTGVSLAWSDNTTTVMTRDRFGIVTVARDGATARAVPMSPRDDISCLREELGRPGVDDIYQEVLSACAHSAL